MKKILAMSVIALCAAAGVAQDLTMSIGWTYNRDGRRRTLATASRVYTIAGVGVIENIQIIPTNTEGVALVMGGVTDPGFGYFNNLGPTVTTTNTPQTNIIEVGSFDINTNFVAFLSVDTNGWASIKGLAVTAPRARATGTNSLLLDYAITDK